MNIGQDPNGLTVTPRSGGVNFIDQPNPFINALLKSMAMAVNGYRDLRGMDADEKRYNRRMQREGEQDAREQRRLDLAEKLQQEQIQNMRDDNARATMGMFGTGALNFAKLLQGGERHDPKLYNLGSETEPDQRVYNPETGTFDVPRLGDAGPAKVGETGTDVAKPPAPPAPPAPDPEQGRPSRWLDMRRSGVGGDTTLGDVLSGRWAIPDGLVPFLNTKTNDGPGYEAPGQAQPSPRALSAPQPAQPAMTAPWTDALKAQPAGGFAKNAAGEHVLPSGWRFTDEEMARLRDPQQARIYLQEIRGRSSPQQFNALIADMNRLHGGK